MKVGGSPKGFSFVGVGNYFSALTYSPSANSINFSSVLGALKLYVLPS